MNKTRLLLLLAMIGLIGIAVLGAQSFEPTSRKTVPASSLSGNEHNVSSPNTDNTLNMIQPAITKQQITATGGNFIVPEGLPFLRVWVSNEGSTVLTVDLKRFGSSESYIFYQVPPGEQLIIPNQGKATGTGGHTINFSGQDGTVAGEYSIDMCSSSEKSQK